MSGDIRDIHSIRLVTNLNAGFIREDRDLLDWCKSFLLVMPFQPKSLSLFAIMDRLGLEESITAGTGIDPAPVAPLPT